MQTKPTPIECDNLVKTLVAARGRAGVTQAQIARRARLSRAYIAQIENGYRLPSARVLHAYADLCALNADALCWAWGCLPEDVHQRLLEEPELWARVRALPKAPLLSTVTAPVD